MHWCRIGMSIMPFAAPTTPVSPLQLWKTEMLRWRIKFKFVLKKKTQKRYKQRNWQAGGRVAKTEQRSDARGKPPVSASLRNGGTFGPSSFPLHSTHTHTGTLVFGACLCVFVVKHWTARVLDWGRGLGRGGNACVCEGVWRRVWGCGAKECVFMFWWRNSSRLWANRSVSMLGEVTLMSWWIFQNVSVFVRVCVCVLAKVLCRFAVYVEPITWSFATVDACYHPRGWC